MSEQATSKNAELFACTERLLPKYGGVASLALNQAALLCGVRIESAEHYKALVAAFEAARQ